MQMYNPLNWKKIHFFQMPVCKHVGLYIADARPIMRRWKITFLSLNVYTTLLNLHMIEFYALIKFNSSISTISLMTFDVLSSVSVSLV